ncbi:Peptidyl-tRNA hydrolase ArfB [Symmachiella dynata]|uniref:alternative ribosome rescue aminoacyl-tRNA hydrolase ArfB n=1 Tax=Symmachiella dynata TaxID=2527995 RepID=UPI00118C5DCB|nr:alternative ribosome rescue aminoacyl-tRNA hydrolase ArfB [Symmachiella dynata]QDT47880.1 Peptidyl-tRNA hydrolase ArfB [Symmachiella dynata]
MLYVNQSIQIPLRELTFTFSRSSGPGGQNVNKLNTKATLRWGVANSPSLSEGVRERFMKTYHRRLTTDGDFVMHSQRFRDQGRNVADCLDKLRQLLLEVAAPPTVRKRKKVSRAKIQKRIDNKRRQSEKKQSRRPPKME